MCTAVPLVERQRSSSSLNMSSDGSPCQPDLRSRTDTAFEAVRLFVVFAVFALPVGVLAAEAFLEGFLVT